MKKLRILTGLGMAIVFLTLSVAYKNPHDNILGLWVLENDSKTEWEFTNTKCNWYYEGKIVDNFTYEIVDLSSNRFPKTSDYCGHEVRSGSNEDYYLKIVNQEGDEFCYGILTITNEKLSLNFLGTVNNMVFNKK
jgi:hypothetical protein